MERELHAGPWRPTAKRAALEARAEILSGIRRFFAQRGVLEVETPLLSSAGNSDPGIEQLSAMRASAWLRTSPEYALKRLLAAGSGDIYELGRVFRGGEAGRHHNREFTLLEWYRVGWDYHALMDEVAGLVRFCADRELQEQRLSYRDLFLAHGAPDPFSAGPEEFARFAGEPGIHPADLGKGQWLDLTLGLVIQPRLPDDTMTFVFDFPPDQAALARIRAGTPPVAERFELFLGQVELANGYQELTDATEQRRRFEVENLLRRSRGEPAVTLDENLLAALGHGLPECSGVALGVDRLLMHISGAASLDEVIPFPAERA